MKKILINNIRNISELEFCIPSPGVHIITGKNGTGKTTLFTCISRICNKNAYRNGFLSSKNDTLDIFMGTIKYMVDDNSVTYSRRANGEWRPNRKNTVLKDFNYPAVVNITTKDERVFSQDAITPRRRNSPDVWINEKLNTIFDTSKFKDMIRITTGDLRHGRASSADNRRRNIAFAIPLGDNKFYTEQNFSFGEIVVLNLLYDIKNAQNGTLVLIDELELALHPSAQIRLLSCLKELAREKGLTIIISTHSASIIKAEKNVILLEQSANNKVEIIYKCPPAKAIGAIGMREDTMPDIIVLVEDNMARGLFYALQQKYNNLQNEHNYLDIRVLEIGGFSNVINFYVEANSYVFYDNVYVVAFMDKDVETDIINYPAYGNQELIRKYNENSYYLKFLPYTPEVLLMKTFKECKRELLHEISINYSHYQLTYDIEEDFNFGRYDSQLPAFCNQEEYNSRISERGAFRKRCKKEVERIASSISQQLNQSVDEIYRYVFKFAVEHISEQELNIKQFLSPTMHRRRVQN